MCRQALREIQDVFDRIVADAGSTDPFAVLALEIAAHREGRIALYGVGREGLMMRALAMRLFHLGLHASVVGDMSAPALGQGDLLVASAGPGTFSTVEALLRVASGAGARTVVLTAQPEGPAPQMADAVVHLPAQTMADDMQPRRAGSSSDDGGVAGAQGDVGAEGVLPMGSVFEGALFVSCEVVVAQLRKLLGESPESMRARHTNME